MTEGTRLELSLRLKYGRHNALGPGKMALLQSIAETGSISAAARSLGMSYRRAWLLVEAMNQLFGQAVVATELGGRRGGGAHLTPLGQEALRRFRAIERKAGASAAHEIAALRRLIAQD